MDRFVCKVFSISHTVLYVKEASSVFTVCSLCKDVQDFLDIQWNMLTDFRISNEEKKMYLYSWEFYFCIRMKKRRMNVTLKGQCRYFEPGVHR